MHNPQRTGAARVARLVAVLLALIDPVVWIFRAAMRVTRYAPTLPRLIRHSTNPFHKRVHGKAVAGGRVFVGSNDGRSYVLDIGSGKVVWEYEDGGALMSSPAIASGRVVFGSSDGRVVCLG